MSKRVSNKKGGGGARSRRTGSIYRRRMAHKRSRTPVLNTPGRTRGRTRSIHKPPFLSRIVTRVKRFFSHSKGR